LFCDGHERRGAGSWVIPQPWGLPLTLDPRVALNPEPRVILNPEPRVILNPEPRVILNPEPRVILNPEPQVRTAPQTPHETLRHALYTLTDTPHTLEPLAPRETKS